MMAILPPKLFIRALLAGLFLIVQVKPQLAEKTITPCELETVLNELTNPNEGYEMHAASLRNQLRNLLESRRENLQNIDDEANQFEEDKRSLASLVRDGYMVNGKRANAATLLRSSILRNSNSIDGIKRSIATLAKNGQLPSREPDLETTSPDEWEDDKRNVGALARSGLLNGKRNLAALVRGGMLPTLPPKRNLASIVRSNSLPYTYETYKRNIGAMARDWALPNQKLNNENGGDSTKRNIGSLKNSQGHTGRKKRELSYNDLEYGQNSEVPEPVYQTSPFDYEELSEQLNNEYPYDLFSENKRFLGRILPPTRPSPSTHHHRRRL